MKKATLKTILSLVLSACLMLGIAACGSTQSPSATASPGTAGNSAEPADVNADPLAPYAEPVTITWAIPTSQVQEFHEGDNWENNEWTRLVKEKLNIDLKIGFSADISTEAYDNKLNAVIASGDLPDVFRSLDVNVFKQLRESDQLADITDVYNQYATDDVKRFNELYPASFEGVTYDGRMYGYPRLNDTFHQTPFLWIRDDWLANTNSQPPKTIADMVALAEKFAKGDPDGNGVDGDTYGLAINSNLISPGYANITGLLSAYGDPSYDQNVFYRDADGKVTHSYLSAGVKDALALLNDMYNKGLIDKEFVAKDNAKQEEEVASGQIGMAYGNNWGTWYPYNMVYENSKVLTHPYAIPTIDGYDYKVGVEANTTGQVTMISASCEHPEAVIKILNLYDQVVNHGTEEDFQFYWADEQYRLCPIYIDMPSELYAHEVIDALKSGDPGTLSGGAKPYFNYVTGFNDGTKTDSNAYGVWGQMSLEGALPIVIDKYIPQGAMVQSILGANRPEVWVQNYSSLETIVLTSFTDIITGNKPVDSFDTFVQDWLKAGGQETLDELDKLYPAK